MVLHTLTIMVVCFECRDFYANVNSGTPNAIHYALQYSTRKTDFTPEFKVFAIRLFAQDK
jgi:hypothetical protein